MKIRKNIAVSDEGFLFNPATGDSFSTNLMGSEIIRLMKLDLPLSEIITHICSNYDVESYVFEKDLDDFISLMKEFNILENYD